MIDPDWKYIYAIIVTVIVASMQIYAWSCGINGAVFAFTSLVIGAVAGSILGFSLNSRK